MHQYIRLKLIFVKFHINSYYILPVCATNLMINIFQVFTTFKSVINYNIHNINMRISV